MIFIIINIKIIAVYYKFFFFLYENNILSKLKPILQFVDVFFQIALFYNNDS